MEYDWKMNERVKEIRLLIGKKQGELAKIIGIKQSSLSDIENSRVRVSDRVIKDLVIGVNVNEEYIRNGIGEPISKTPSSTMEQLKKEFDLDEFSYNLVYEYLKLDKAKRDIIRKYLYSVLDKTNTDENAVTNIHDVHTKSSNKTMTDDEIDDLVKNYRYQLETEKKQKEKLLVLQNESSKETKRISNL